MEDLPLIMGERDCRDMGRVRAAARRAKQQLADTEHGLRLTVVDYVQRMKAPTGSKVSFYEEASMASDVLKDIAMTLDVPVNGLPSLSRDVGQRDPPVPILSDLKDSGRLEEDADNVIFAYRAVKYLQERLDRMDEGDDERTNIESAVIAARGKLDLVVAKVRNGRLGAVRTDCLLGLNLVGDARHLRDVPRSPPATRGRSYDPDTRT